MALLSSYQKKVSARRKTSDIERLANQFNTDIGAVTSDYETAFADYTKKRDEVMAPYNAAVDTYKKDFSLYEESLAKYKNNLNAYTTQLENYQNNPVVAITAPHRNITRNGYRGMIITGVEYQLDGNWYDRNNLPDGYTYESGQLYKTQKAPTFTEKAPTAPESPTAPTVADFDSTQFEQKKAALETNFKREVAERKSARLGAVSRKSARPLLQGA